MQVNVPENLPQELQYGDPFVLLEESNDSDDGFARFLEQETSKLREEFVSEDNLDRNAYAQVFDSSLGLVKNILEQIWNGRIQWNEDITEGVLLVEENKIVLCSKMEDFRREMDELSWWHRLPFFNMKIREKIDFLRESIAELDDEINKVDAIMDKEARNFWKTRKVNERKIGHIFRWNTIGEEALGIPAQLRRFLLIRQARAMGDYAAEFNALYQARFSSKLGSTLDRMNEWAKCLDEEVKQIKKTSIVVKWAGHCVGVISLTYSLIVLFVVFLAVVHA